jgi:hypothetical protein
MPKMEKTLHALPPDYTLGIIQTKIENLPPKVTCKTFSQQKSPGHINRSFLQENAKKERNDHLGLFSKICL